MMASAGYRLQRERNSYPIALINADIPAQAGIHRGGAEHLQPVPIYGLRIRSEKKRTGTRDSGPRTHLCYLAALLPAKAR
jgi:hypothetical protein